MLAAVIAAIASSNPLASLEIAGLMRVGAIVALVPLLLWSWERWESTRDPAARERRRRRFVALATGVMLLFGLQCLWRILVNVRAPDEWDFMAYWLWGQAGARGLDFYDPAALATIASGFEHSRTFKAEIVDAGFHYPPQTMLLLAPLGWFDVRPALIAWYGVNLAALAASLVLLARIFISDRGGAILLCAAMLLIHPATPITLRYAQTNFLVLLVLLLYWRDRQHARGGVWLALLPVLKPYMALMAWHPVVRGRWRVLGMAAVASLAIVLASALIFGPGVFARFLADKQTTGYPPWLLFQDMNQSLLAVLLRGSDARALSEVRSLVPIYLGLSALIIPITTLAVVRSRQERGAWGAGAILGMTLLLNPATLSHYSVLLVAPMMLLWSERETLPGGWPTAAALIALVYAMAAVPGGSMIFWSLALTWLVMTARGLYGPVKDDAPVSATP